MPFQCNARCSGREDGEGGRKRLSQNQSHKQQGPITASWVFSTDCSLFFNFTFFVGVVSMNPGEFLETLTQATALHCKCIAEQQINSLGLMLIEPPLKVTPHLFLQADCTSAEFNQNMANSQLGLLLKYDILLVWKCLYHHGLFVAWASSDCFQIGTKFYQSIKNLHL